MASVHEVMGMNAESRAKVHQKKVLDHIRIVPAENGGHTVEHHFESHGSYREPENHVFGKGEHKEMIAHVEKALKLPEPTEEEAGQEHEEDGEGDD